jgi:hypothetical protein
MSRIPDIGRGLYSYASRCSSRYSLRFIGLAAAALLALSSATSQRAQALSLINPGAAATANVAGDGLTIEARFGGHGGGHGFGGHGFGGHALGAGSFHGGAAAFHGSGFRTGPMFHGSGVRYAGFRYGGHRFGHRHHFRRFFVGGIYYDYPYYDYPYYDYPAYYAVPGCRIVMTDDGPRRICINRPWRHHHYRHHHHRRHHHVYR